MLKLEYLFVGLQVGQGFCNSYVGRKEKMAFQILRDFIGAGGPEGYKED